MTNVHLIPTGNYVGTNQVFKLLTVDETDHEPLLDTNELMQRTIEDLRKELSKRNLAIGAAINELQKLLK